MVGRGQKVCVCGLLVEVCGGVCLLVRLAFHGALVFVFVCGRLRGVWALFGSPSLEQCLWFVWDNIDMMSLCLYLMEPCLSAHFGCFWVFELYLYRFGELYL